MEKIIYIDGKEVPLKVTFGCLRMYKMQFRRDLIKDLFKMKSFEKFVKDSDKHLNSEALEMIDFELFSNLLWIFAKKANPSIPSPMEWEDQFETINFIEIFSEIMELLNVLLDGQKKQKAQPTQ